MALSQRKQAKIVNDRIQREREANIRAVAITKSLHNPFMDANEDPEAREYLRTGKVGSRLAMHFASHHVTV